MVAYWSRLSLKLSYSFCKFNSMWQIEAFNERRQPVINTGTVSSLILSRNISKRALATRISAPATILGVTRERWAQIGITTQFLIVVRTLGEVFRLKHVHGTNFSASVAMPYVGGALIAACCCWACVAFYFFRRYTLSFCIALATVIILIVYKIAVIG